MNTQTGMSCDREQISSLVDGALPEPEWAAALQAMEAPEARECWHLYHLIGDVLRTPDLAGCDRGARYAGQLTLSAQDRTVPALAPATVVADPARPAANDGVFRWKVAAGLASFAAVAAIGWGVLGSIGPQAPGPAMQLADNQTQAVPRAAVPVMVAGPGATPAGGAPAVIWRDPELDKFLAAHRQAAGASAFGDSNDFLRNATFEGHGR